MKIAELYKEASERNYLLRVTTDGATLTSINSDVNIPLVIQDEKGIRSVVEKTWEASLADRLAAIMRSEESKRKKALEPKNKGEEKSRNFLDRAKSMGGKK